MPRPNAPAEYVQLAFMIDRHFPGYVDAYFGPPRLKAQASTGVKPPLEALQDSSASLAETISTDPGLSSERRSFFEGQLGAMRTTIRILMGDGPSFIDEVRLLFGVTRRTSGASLVPGRPGGLARGRQPASRGS
jgi:hypothetical protein